MESPFTHNTIATGSDFLSRKKDVSQLVSIIADGRHAVIYEPPRTGNAHSSTRHSAAMSIIRGTTSHI